MLCFLPSAQFSYSLDGTAFEEGQEEEIKGNGEKDGGLCGLFDVEGLC